MYSTRKRFFVVFTAAITLLSACTFSFGGGGQQVDPNQQATNIAASLIAQLTQTAQAIINSGGGGGGVVVAPTNTQGPPPPPSDTPAPSATNTQGVTTVSVSVDTNCRTGPGLAYLIRGYLLVGEVAQAVGKPESGSDYLIIQNPDISGDNCWVWLQYATVVGPLDSLTLFPIPPIPHESSIAGKVWLDKCSAGAPGSPPPGCVNAEGGGYRANGVLNPDEVGIQHIVVLLGSGACPSTGLATATTNASGNYFFDNLAYGTYCVSINPLGDGNDVYLIPGMWTYPSVVDGTIRFKVELAAGEDKVNVNFGWDFQLD